MTTHELMDYLSDHGYATTVLPNLKRYSGFEHQQNLYYFGKPNRYYSAADRPKKPSQKLITILRDLKYMPILARKSDSIIRNKKIWYLLLN
jgi:hypothetical protein